MPCLLHLDQRPDKRPNQCAANFRTRAARSAACPGRNHAACSGLTQQARHAIARLWHVRMYMHAGGRQPRIYGSRSYVLSARLARRAAQALVLGRAMIGYTRQASRAPPFTKRPCNASVAPGTLAWLASAGTTARLARCGQIPDPTRHAPSACRAARIW